MCTSAQQFVCELFKWFCSNLAHASLGSLKPSPIATPARTSKMTRPKPAESVTAPLTSRGKVPEVSSSISAKSTPIKSPESKKTKVANDVVDAGVVRRLSGPLDAAAEPHQRDTPLGSMDATSHVPCL